MLEERIAPRNQALETAFEVLRPLLRTQSHLPAKPTSAVQQM